jgi:hypothetical protein
MSDLITSDKWKPVLRGGIYCSPKCGCGCTKEAFDLATMEANDLCKRLGTRWTPSVWENCGWHYSAQACDGLFAIHPSKNYRKHPTPHLWVVDGYTAWIHTQPQFISENNADPLAAMKEAIGEMQSLFDKVSNAMRTADLLDLKGAEHD